MIKALFDKTELRPGRPAYLCSVTRRLLPLLILLLFLPATAKADTGKVYQLQTEGSGSQLQTVFVDKSGKRTVIPDSNLPSGTPARLQSRTIQQTGPAPRYSVRGQRGALIVSIGWPGAPGPEIDAEEYAPLTEWSEQASDGLFRWSPVTALQVELPRQPSCDEYSWRSATLKKLRSMGYAPFENYGALAIMVPEGAPSECVGTAYSYVGCFLDKRDSSCGMSYYSAEATSYPVVVHELGHTVGLGHASRVPCRENGVLVSLSYGGQCELVEYGDRFDPMGTSWQGNLFHPLFAEEIGWMSDASFLPLDGQTHSLELSPYGSLGTGRAAFVALPPAWSDASPGTLGIEYRTQSGLDSLLYGSRCSPEEGILLRVRRGALGELNSYPVSSDSASILLDTHPETEDICDAGLQPGESWSDPTGGLRISFLSRGATALLSIQTPALQPATVSLRPPRRRQTRSKNFSFSVISSREVSGISRDDFFFSGPSRGCRFYVWSSESWFFQNEGVGVVRCRPGRVQVGLRAAALRDEFGFLAPGSDVLLPPIKILPRKKRR